VKIIQLIQIERGWSACFLVKTEEIEGIRCATFGQLPVVCLGLVETRTRGDHNLNIPATVETAVRPFVIRTSGAIVCVDDIKLKFECLVGPNESARSIIKTIEAYAEMSVYETQAIS
jgi:hypothetical protein